MTASWLDDLSSEDREQVLNMLADIYAFVLGPNFNGGAYKKDPPEGRTPAAATAGESNNAHRGAFRTDDERVSILAQGPSAEQVSELEREEVPFD